jgi:16S rRNA (guanine1516-N2)-methyltransferase
MLPLSDPSPIATIAVLDDHTEAQVLAEHLRLPLVTAPAPNTHFLLSRPHGILTIQWLQSTPPMSLTVDFLQGALAYRQRRAGKQEAIARAVGIKGTYRPYVVDATAGLGRDAFILASLGCKVTLIEQHPIVMALLRDGLQRLLAVQTLAMELYPGNARQILPQLSQAPDVIYLDPMFPPRPNTALVKKDMQILQQLTLNDIAIDNAALFELALAHATRRVVVKRPDYAPSLTDRKPDFTIATKHHRFDVFTRNYSD